LILLITFDNVAGALMGEKLVKDSGLSCDVVPVPRKLGSSCNYALSFACDDPDPVLRLLREKGAGYAKAYYREDENETDLHELCLNPSI
jgi:hypothetical protein